MLSGATHFLWSLCDAQFPMSHLEMLGWHPAANFLKSLILKIDSSHFFVIQIRNALAGRDEQFCLCFNSKSRTNLDDLMFLFIRNLNRWTLTPVKEPWIISGLFPFFFFFCQQLGFACFSYIGKFATACAHVCMCGRDVCSSPALAVGVSVIISTSVAMETISVTLIGFIARRVGTCWTGIQMEGN